MASQLLQKLSVIYGVAGISAAIIIIARLLRRPSVTLDAFPTVGSSGFLDSWRAGFKFRANCIDVIREGYEQHKSVPFKVADRYRWIVILNKCDHLEELRRVPEDELSLAEATSDRLSTRYTLGDEVHDNPYHVAVLRSQLSRNIERLYPGIRDEIVTVFDEILHLGGNEWKSVSALSTMRKVICRASNRLFVGLPLCRNADWIDLNIQHTIRVFETGSTIGLFPKFMRPLVARFFTVVAQDILRAVKHVGPMIEERLKLVDECGDSQAEMPNDLISWLIREADGPGLTVESLTVRMLFFNFAAIHTTSNSFTHALFYLAANPQYIKPLREEVEGIIQKEGWSKAALGKMLKVDSFLSECQRMEGISILSLWRKAMKDFTFSDGTFIPKGTTIVVASRFLHHDERFYENADVFDPFRFAEMRKVGGWATKHQFASTTIEYQPFGYGNHACPGRFFAATVLKTVLAHIVTTYDVKLEDGATRPRSLYVGTSISPDPCAKVMFRARID